MKYTKAELHFHAAEIGVCAKAYVKDNKTLVEKLFAQKILNNDSVCSIIILSTKRKFN